MLRNFGMALCALVTVGLFSSDASAGCCKRRSNCNSGCGYVESSCCGGGYSGGYGYSGSGYGYGNYGYGGYGNAGYGYGGGYGYNPGGIGGPASGLGVRPGMGVGGLGPRR
jgi:hypothetical protein